MMKRLLMTLTPVLLLAALPYDGHGQSEQKIQHVHVGGEADLLPYLTGGYYGSLWIQIDHIRIRGVVSRVHIPSFAVPQGFRDHKLSAVALIADYLPSGQVDGLWLGAGLEHWAGTITAEYGRQEIPLRSLVATAGAGYVIPLTAGFYLNPWGAFHVLLTGTDAVPAGPTPFTPRRLTGEVSLKLGYQL